MQKIDLQDLVSEILVAVPSCPSVLAEKALIQAIRQWYEETHCWKEQLPEIVCFSDVDTYVLRKDACASVLSIYSAKVGNKPCYTQFLQPDRIRVYEKVKDNQLLIVTAALSLHANASSVSCSHADRYLAKWNDGALWQLLAMPNQIWSDKEQAEYRRVMFRSSINQERNEELSGRQYGSQRVVSRFIL